MKRILSILGILVIVGLILSACGASLAPEPAKGTAPQTSGSTSAPRPMATAAPAAAPALAPTSEGLKATDQAISNAAGGATSATDRLIIRNGSITIVVKDVLDTVAKVTGIANASDGYVLSSSSRVQNESLVATVTIKVPASGFDNVFVQLRKLAIKVDAENSNSQDVTEEYVDLQARLKVYEATEQQLMTFLQRTLNVDESLKVYRELNNVRAQIESAKGRMNYLAKSAAMSTITVQIRAEEKEKPIVEEEGWNPGKVVRDALRWLASALQWLFQALVFVIFGVLPILVAIAVPVLLVRWLWWRLRRRKA